MSGSYVMKVSSNGQVSIPAEARARWGATRMLVLDLGDRIVMRPLPDDPLGEIRGKYRGRGPSTDEARREARAEEAEAEARRSRQ
jgi:bifunctional DNA-binding transcriptional regulator/antitoxin component of YhaV-PrlF toxin-antitoxin module